MRRSRGHARNGLAKGHDPGHSQATEKEDDSRCVRCRDGDLGNGQVGTGRWFVYWATLDCGWA